MDPMEMEEEQEISEEDPRPFWQRLPTRLLNERGKRIVNADPDLREETVSALLRVHPPKGTYRFYFGNNDDCDVGAVGLALCIGDNLQATMAELVARYAAMRKVPFTDTALAVLEQYHNRGLFYYEHRKDKDHPVLRRWDPNDVGIIAPPPKKGKSGEEILDPIALELLAFEAPPRKRVKVDANGKRLPDMGNMSFEEYKRRQREGIERARAEGRLGKKPKVKPDNFGEIVALWREKNISTAEASRQLGVCNKTFLKWEKEKGLNVK